MTDYRKIHKILTRLTENKDILGQFADMASQISEGKTHLRIQVDFVKKEDNYINQRFFQDDFGRLHPIKNDNQITIEVKDDFALDFVSVFYDTIHKQNQKLKELYREQLEK